MSRVSRVRSSPAGKQVWIDTSGIEDTEVFPLAIRSAIESSDAFLFVISPAAVASRFCEQEVDYADSLNKRLVPVLRDRVPDEELPEPIRERSWIPFELEAEFDSSLARVLSALEHRPRVPPEPHALADEGDRVGQGAQGQESAASRERAEGRRGLAGEHDRAV